jgi:hypothetical protein
MIRKINYTGRIRIPRSDIVINVTRTGEKFGFDADLKALEKYNLPKDALVFIEAYRQTSWMRFPFGTIQSITPPENRTLQEFDSPEGIFFRVKVTNRSDVHKLLAEADGIPLVKPDQKKDKTEPLLPVKPQKLGHEVYRVDFSGITPLLLINSELGIKESIVKSSQFAALAYPAILREILTRILIVEKYRDPSNAEDWQSKWLNFSLRLPGVEPLPVDDDDQEIFDWIDSVISSFARKNNLKDRFEEYWNREMEQ